MILNIGHLHPERAHNYAASIITRFLRANLINGVSRGLYQGTALSRAEKARFCTGL